MKHILTPVFGLLSALAAFGQSPLLSSEMLTPGHTVNARFIEHFDDIDTTVQGTGATWDFTALAEDLDQAAFTMTIVDPANTPNGSLFPTANYAWREGPNNYYRYFNLTAAHMERVGSYTASSQIFVDPQIEMVYPMNVGTTSTDDWETEFDGGEYRMRCIGAGTLVLPGVTFEDVLMVRARVSGGLYTLNAYFWYSANGAILLQYIVGDGLFIATQGLFAEGVVADVPELSDVIGAAINNPVSDRLQLSMSAQAYAMDYSMLSVTGAVQRAGRIAPGSTMEQFAVQDLAPGMYVLELRNAQGSLGSMRFVKE